MNFVPLILAGFIIVMTILVVASLRRNSKMIEGLGDPELGELSVCFDERNAKWAEKELGARGWRLVEIASAPEHPGKAVLLFHKTEAGEPVKAILHFLNRKLKLPVGKWEFSRASKANAE